MSARTARWVEVRRTFTPPPPFKKVSSWGEYDNDRLHDMLVGVTVIEYHDRKGRKRPQFVHVVGDVR